MSAIYITFGKNTNIMHIGQTIRKLRKEKLKELNQGEFAVKAGITQSYLSLLERGHKEPSPTTLKKIAEVLDIPLAVIFWYGLEEKDIQPEKLELFKQVKPIIDEMIRSIA